MKNGKKKNAIYMDANNIDFLSDDDINDIPDIIIEDDMNMTSENSGFNQLLFTEPIIKSPPFFKKVKTEKDETNKKLYKIEKDIQEYNNNNNNDAIDIRQKILLLDIDIETKSSIINKYDQPFNILNSGDNNKFITWVNNLIKIPFGKYKKLEIDDKVNYIKKFKEQLDSVSYGHYKSKEQLMEFVAKFIANPNSKGNVIALEGSPGVGKTSLIRKGLSKALNRPFYSINFGGLTDTSVLVGHNSTYVGSKYGRIVDILIRSQYMNPIIYLDEIDKISGINTGNSTEIFGILTHLLDEEQNKEFFDNYFEGVKIDLSKILFVISYNDINNIDKIVSDRMKIIKVDNPTIDDKINIAKCHLIPEILNDVNMEGQIYFDDNVIKMIINKIEQEDGVRKLKKQLETIIERINLLFITNNEIEFTYNIDISLPILVTEDIVNKIGMFSRMDASYSNMYL